MSKIRILAILALCLMLAGCQPRTDGAARVLVDGVEWDGAALGGGGDLRVYVTLDGKALIYAPFDEARLIEVVQPDGAENAVRITGDSVVMEHANCENQDCVEMGAVTRDNLELRVMSGFIVCLPHKLSVEVRGK